jgi:hypothetical protein
LTPTLSLALDGAELPVLQTMPWDKVKYPIVTISTIENSSKFITFVAKAIHNDFDTVRKARKL